LAAAQRTQIRGEALQWAMRRYAHPSWPDARHWTPFPSDGNWKAWTQRAQSLPARVRDNVTASDVI